MPKRHGKRGPKHHSTVRGKRVVVTLRSGTVVFTKFLRRTDNQREIVTEAGTFTLKQVVGLRPWTHRERERHLASQ